MNDVLEARGRIASPVEVSSLAHASPFSYIFYELSYLFSMTAMTLGFSLRTLGKNNIPRTGPAILYANHQSYLDPMLVGLSSRRHLCFLARKTLFRNRFFAGLIRNLNAVPIDQEGVGRQGIQTVLDQLRLGQAVVVFPEGERTEDGVMHPLKPGLHLLIKKSAAPLLPVGIAGAFDAWPRFRRFPMPSPLFLPKGKRALAVCVGKPLDGGRFAALPRQQAMDELFIELSKVQRQAEKLRGMT
jgi:1-acyl-sn-glycerol-3-phosphate acyltransferase